MLNEFISSGLWIQFFGAIGYALVVLGGLSKSRSKLLTLELVGIAIVTAQWFLLGSPSLAIAQMIFAYAIVTGLFVDQSKLARYLSVLSLPLMAVLIFGFGEGSLLFGCCVLGASSFGLFAKTQMNMKSLRALSIIGSSSWLILNISSGSIPGAMCNISYICVHCYALFQLCSAHIQPNYTQKVASA
jgi:hypothetical protein